jgi:hypothetical protein
MKFTAHSTQIRKANSLPLITAKDLALNPRSQFSRGLDTRKLVDDLNSIIQQVSVRGHILAKEPGYWAAAWPNESNGAFLTLAIVHRQWGGGNTEVSTPDTPILNITLNTYAPAVFSPPF